MNKRLELHIKHMTDEQQEVLVKFLDTVRSDVMSKGDLMQLLDNREKIDSAMPIDYVRKVQELVPSFETWAHGYSYINNSFGQVINIPQELLLQLHRKLNIVNY